MKTPNTPKTPKTSKTSKISKTSKAPVVLLQCSRADEVRLLREKLHDLAMLARGLAAHLGMDEAYIECVRNEAKLGTMEVCAKLAGIRQAREELFAASDVGEKLELMKRLPQENRRQFEAFMGMVAEVVGAA